MTVSQLTYVMSRDSRISVHDGNKTVYSGSVRGTKKDDPVNKMYVTKVRAIGNSIFVQAVEPTNKRGGRS